MPLTVLQTLALLIGSYLSGSIPTAYLAGRLLKGIDIRQYGSGNVGGSNVYNNVAKWAVVPVGVFDILKVAFPTWLALYPLDLGYGLAISAGICAMLGHAWSICLGLTGGRGLSGALGILVVVFPWGALIFLIILAIGWRLDRTEASSVALLLMPLLSLVFGLPPQVAVGCVVMIVVTGVKRVEANRAPLPTGPEKWRVIWRRLWLDRDLASHDEWLTRRPQE